MEEQSKSNEVQIVQQPSQPFTNKKLLVRIAAVLGVLIAVGAGAYFYTYQTGPKEVVCTQEAKICPDGTTVGRTGPNCEFAPCPSDVSSEVSALDSFDTSTWKTFRSNRHGFEVKYPSDWNMLTAEEYEDGSGYVFSSSADGLSGHNFSIGYVPNDIRRLSGSVDRELTKVLGYDVRIEEIFGGYQAYITKKPDTLELSYLNWSDQPSLEADKKIFETLLSTLKFDEVMFGEDVLSYEEKINIQVQPWPFTSVFTLTQLVDGEERGKTYKKYYETRVVDENNPIYTPLPDEFLSTLPPAKVMSDAEFKLRYTDGYFEEDGTLYNIGREECANITHETQLPVCKDKENTFYILDVREISEETTWKTGIRYWSAEIAGINLSAVPEQGFVLPKEIYDVHQGFYETLRNNSRDYFDGEYYYFGVTLQKKL